MSADATILSGKRKRAVVSYKEPDDLAEFESESDEPQLPTKATRDDSEDSDDDEDAFTTHRKVCISMRFISPVNLINKATEVDEKGATEEEGPSCEETRERKELPLPGFACRTPRHDL